jgi:hypothetical protein
MKGQYKGEACFSRGPREAKERICAAFEFQSQERRLDCLSNFQLFPAKVEPLSKRDECGRK